MAIRSLLTSITAAGLAALSAGALASFQVPQTPLPGSSIPQFVDPVPVFGPAGTIPRVPGPNITVTMDEFRLGVAETLDVIVTPEDDNAYSIFCQAIDRSGFAAGTLSSAAGVVATRPPLDPVPVLGHREMGMGHGGHGRERRPSVPGR